MTDLNNVPNVMRNNQGGRRPRLGVFAAVLAALAIGAGVTAVAERGHQMSYVALTPSAISAMKDDSAVAVKGDVAEIFGNKFVVHDDTGRALIETGRRGEGQGLVAQDEKVTVQGRFEHGFIHAIAIQHADGRTDTLDPPPPPRPAPGRGPDQPL